MFAKKFMTHTKSYNLNITTISEKLDGKVDEPKKTSKCFLGFRHVATFIGFSCCFLVSANRMVLSVGIVAMVKHTHTEETDGNNSIISCPKPSGTSKLSLESNDQGEFDWSTELQGYVLGAGFLSYLTTQVPAGRLVDKIGTKHLLLIPNGLTGVLTLISPFAARWNIYALLTVQLLRGACQGILTPSIYKMISNWIPRNERGCLSTLIMCGYATGIAIPGMITGWLCDVPGLGWPFAFYSWGIISLLASVIFYFIYFEYPKDHPWITDDELTYITEGLETKISEKQPPTPWRKMLSSLATYAYFYGLFGHYWTIAYFVSVHPQFMGTILHYPMTQNGINSCLPVLMKTVGGVIASLVSYWISKKNLMRLNKVRKSATIIGAFGFSICMVGILLAGCDVLINILCFTLSLFCSGIAISGIVISGVDMAPNFAGSLMGVASTIAGLACVLIPVITGLLTTHETLSEWQIIFWINLIVVASSGFVYLCFGSAEVQPWNYPETECDTEMTSERRKHADIKLKQTLDVQ